VSASGADDVTAVPAAAPVVRTSGRLLCVDPSGRALLERCIDPGDPGRAPRWGVPGGGVDPDEDVAAAARREAFEELGLTADGPLVHLVDDEQSFSWLGTRYLGRSTVFAARTRAFEPVPVGVDELEVEATLERSWLNPDDLRARARAGDLLVSPELPAWVSAAHAVLPPEPVRPTVRVLVVDPDDRVLLMRMTGPDGGFWFPPGGGIDPGERPAQTAVRELGEELGLQVEPDALGPCVWSRRHVLPHREGWDGVGVGADVRERWYLLRTEAFEPDRTGWTAQERAEVQDLRWWTLEQVRDQTCDAFTPRALGTLLPALLADHAAGRLEGRAPAEVAV
jgi:8-oxo-dGTP pyrophosphatase MutT (NUDIX family)